NSMYKKMLRVSDKVHQYEGSCSTPDQAKESVQRALDYLWAGQCNCSYWHGVFGGLYLPMLRQSIYSSLINAEKVMDSDGGRNGSAVAGVERIDFDGDGNEELLI